MDLDFEIKRGLHRRMCLAFSLKFLPGVEVLPSEYGSGLVSRLRLHLYPKRNACIQVLVTSRQIILVCADDHLVTSASS